MKRRLWAAVLLAVPVLGVAPLRAGQDDPRLGPLFDALRAAASDEAAAAAERQIWQIWIEHKNPEIARLMREGIAAMSEDDQDAALGAFDAIVKYDRNFAEGWNKRATVEFAMGDFDASIADIERTLALEPRHFGALSGLGRIYLSLGRKDLALKAFRAALAIDPHLDGLRAAVKELEKSIKGTPL
ncbi:MAG TPA: tetratricopeptide repeat protein [Stellaceae bacterium]|nr:tetratricopeptide repeat protein [Stellaceae bacterium]